MDLGRIVGYGALSYSVVAASSLLAGPVSLEQASIAARAFTDRQIARQANAVAKKSVPVAGDIQEIRDVSGRRLAFVINHQQNGFVVISADDRIVPVLGYSSLGTFPVEDSPSNVLRHLVQWDMESRLAALDIGNDSTKKAAKVAQDDWQAL